MRCLVQINIAFLFYFEFFKILFFFGYPLFDKSGQHLRSISYQYPLLLGSGIYIHKYPDIVDIAEIRMTTVSPLYDNEGASYNMHCPGNFLPLPHRPSIAATIGDFFIIFLSMSVKTSNVLFYQIQKRVFRHCANLLSGNLSILKRNKSRNTHHAKTLRQSHLFIDVNLAHL